MYSTLDNYVHVGLEANGGKNGLVVLWSSSGFEICLAHFALTPNYLDIAHKVAMASYDIISFLFRWEIQEFYLCESIHILQGSLRSPFH